MKLKIKTIPDLSETSPAHQYALSHKEENFRAWSDTRNVIDSMKGMSDEDIKIKLSETAFPFACLFENWINDFNISTGIRNANAMNVKEVYYLGNKKFDRRGAISTYIYTPVKWLETIELFLELKNKYTFIGIDNIDGAVPIDDYQWKINTLVIFGTEGTGLTPFIQKECEELVYIPQFGSTRSMNCGTVSGIVLHDMVSKYRKSLI